MEISPEIIDLCQSALEQELRNTRIASKQLNKAMKNGVQDIELLCQMSNCKLALRHNMDLSRIPSPTEKDYARLERYKSEYMTLMEMLEC